MIALKLVVATAVGVIWLTLAWGGEEPVAPPPETSPAAEAPPVTLPADAPPGLYAILQTTMGDIICVLFENRTPKTVENFVGLAQGTKEWTDYKARKKVKRPFYDGLIFHRVIPGFMIQGGCPRGDGFGGPGYKFGDEIVPTLKFDRPGLLAMANAGPNTNGSQFFITEEPTPHLDGLHTIFGQTVDEDSLMVVRRIARVERDDNDKPLEPVTIKRIVIQRVEKPDAPPQSAPQAPAP